MKISGNLNIPFQSQQLKRDKKSKESMQIASENFPKNANEMMKDVAQRKLSEIQEARMNKGEDNPKAQSIINTFKSGKKLSKEEMNYIRKHAPAMVDYIDRIIREREMIELSMRTAPTKSDVQLVAYRASKSIEKYPNPEEREIRVKHLANAKQEYEQTEEYKEKPSSPLNKEQPRIKSTIRKKEEHTYTVAIKAYEKMFEV